MDFANIIQTIAIYALPVLFAITVHEAAHGYVARHFGDNTAAALGRVTLNPFKHIDPIGTIVIPLAMYLMTAGAFLFGYAKPVPVNFGRLKNPRRDGILVALAGPMSNLLQAILWGVALYLLRGMDVEERFFVEMCRAGVLVNVVMMVFNLFPLPPLDGGRVVAGLLPPKAAMTYGRIEPWGFFIVMGLLVAGIISNWWMRPLMALTFDFLDLILSPLAAILR